MTQPETLRYETTGAVATLTLDRPKALNALNLATLRELEAATEAFAADSSLRVLLLTGAGDRAFAAGADIRELVDLDAASGQAFAAHGQRVFSALERCGKPVIACLNGLALGGGLELALACTCRLASDSAQLGLPEARLGLIPGFGGLYRLTRLIGRSAALRLLLTAQPVDAPTALRLGLVDEVVPHATLLPRAHELATAMASLAPLALAALLELDRRQEGLTADAAFALEAESFGQLCATTDKQAGVSAFLQKQAPIWQGK